MTISNLEQLKFPIGRFNKPDQIENSEIEGWIADIKNLPEQIKLLVSSLNAKQLDWNYRPEGWSIKQVIHHCADSHMNAYMRFKLALTEDNPTIRPYFEDRWAQLPDANDNDLTDSLTILKGLHNRWVKMLANLDKQQLLRKFTHPEHDREFTLAETIGNYAWHCRHHLAHIQQAIVHKGSF